LQAIFQINPLSGLISEGLKIGKYCKTFISPEKKTGEKTDFFLHLRNLSGKKPGFFCRVSLCHMQFFALCADLSLDKCIKVIYSEDECGFKICYNVKK